MALHVEPAEHFELLQGEWEHYVEQPLRAAGKEPPKLFMVTVGVRWGQGQLLELATLRTPTTAPIVPGSQPATTTGTQQPITSGTGQQPTISGSRPGGSTFGSQPGGSTGFGIR